MTTLTRALGKAMLKSLSNYETMFDLVSKASDADKPVLAKSHSKFRDNLDEHYVNLCCDWKSYKEDIGQGADEFNKVDEDTGQPVIKHNDDWFSKVQEAYIDLCEKSDDTLEKQANTRKVNSGEETKADQDLQMRVQHDKKVGTLLSSQIESESESIRAAVVKLGSEVTAVTAGALEFSKAESFKAKLMSLSDRLNVGLQSLVMQCLPMIEDGEADLKNTLHNQFMSVQRSKLAEISSQIAEKSEKKPVTAAYSVEQKSSKDQTFLKKIDPPKFDGEEISYPDFKRKWIANVSKSNLSPESELDRLRDNVPPQAAKMLFGEVTMAGAWSIMDNLYGNKTIIANKLKTQLKTIKAVGKEDFDVVINLAIDVKTIDKRLRSLNLQQMLCYDDEYLSSVFRALPSSERLEWLKFEKSGYSFEWEAMMVFLEQARVNATQTKVLLSCYGDQSEEKVTCRRCGVSGHKKANCPVKINALKTSKVGSDSRMKIEPPGLTADGSDSSDDDSDDEAEEKNKKEREKEMKRRVRDKCGKCPICKERHTFTRKKDGKEWPSDRLISCAKFLKMTPKDRALQLEKASGCSRCTAWTHKKSGCAVTDGYQCGLDKNGVKCQSDHSRLVCGSGVAYCGHVNILVSSDSSSRSSSSSSSSSSSDAEESLTSSHDSSESEDSSFPDLEAETLLIYQDMKIDGVQGEHSTCFDDGSNRCLIRNDFAKENKLRSQKVKYRLNAVGSEEKVEETELYMFDVTDRDGVRTKVWAFGIDDIMPAPDPVDLLPVSHLFPHVPDQAFSTKPRKPVQILIGNNFLSLQPSGGEGKDSVDNLRALHSRFGCGWVIVGAHPLLGSGSSNLSAQANSMARIHRCDISPVLSSSFWFCECLGVQPPKRCGRCLQCATCSDPGLIHSRRDQEDLDILKKGVQLVDGELRVQYQFSKDPRSLPNNRFAAVKIAEKLEKKLVSSGHLDYYNQEMQKVLDRGAAIKLSPGEIESWQGPVNYISHHGVEQDSVTTPLRIVTNSSLNNGGKSLNDCLISGPNSLNSMFDIMLRFRCHESGLVFDLTKAYNSLKTGQVERHVRRFIWRFNSSDPWQDFAFDCVAFGDCPAANFLEIGRDMTAEAGKDIDEVAAQKIINDSYVDDGVTGGSHTEVEKMKGARLADGSFTGTLTQILARGKLKPKVILTTGETDEAVKNLVGNKVLGYDWDATSDGMAVRFPVNVTEKKNKKLRSGPNLTIESLPILKEVKLTTRLCLGVTNSFLDFMGIACPFTLRFKLLMKDLILSRHEQKQSESSSKAWDEKISEFEKEKWLELIAEAVKSDSICFPRTTKPADAIGNPLIASFGDGAFPAFSAGVYIRWETPCSHSNPAECDGHYLASLLCAKARVTPQSGLTIPRSELSGMLLQSRLTLTSVKALQTEPSMKPTGVVMMNDSRCSISSVDKSTTALKPFFLNRVSEILENMSEMRKYCEVEEIQHVGGELNPADLATRGGAKVTDLGPGSFWQQGPFFLSLRRELWPVSRSCVKEDLPEEEVRTRKAVVVAMMRGSVVKRDTSKLPDLWKAVQRILNYSNNIVLVKRILARVVRCWKVTKTVDVVSPDPTAEELIEAEQLLLVSAMVETATAYNQQKLTSLLPEREGMLIVTRGRLGEECLSAHLGVSSLPIIMPHTRAAHLYMTRAHCGEHGTEHKGIVETLARSRSIVWIHRGRDLAKKICNNCPLCKIKKKKLCGQQMARIRPERLVVCRPWTYIALDFAGPYKVKGVVNSRARIKCWIIVYVCCSTKAVCLLSTYGYSTQCFLIRHEEFVARKGAPSKIVSDRGSQLVSAGRVLEAKESPESWDWARITSENKTTSWEFVPIGSQHRNGLPEATVKVLKNSLAHALHPGVILDYGEFITLLARISYSINQRPLGLGHISQSSMQEDNMMPLTPNMMLLGRTSNESPPMEYNEDERFCARLNYVATVETEWWKKWVKEVMPTLLPYTKWKKEQKNLKPGDVVLMRYEGNVKDDYKLAMVEMVHPDEKGLVRTVTVKFRKKNMRESKLVCNSKALIREKVAVQRLHFLASTDDACETSAAKEDNEVDEEL